MQRAAWLVDMGYVVKAGKECGLRVDYVAARDIVGTRHGIVDAFLFNSYDSVYGIPRGLEAFYHAMEQQGMVVRLQPMSGDTAEGTHKQSRVDVDLACHAMWQASLPDIQTIVITTGDQDLVPAVELCREKFLVKVVLFTYEVSVSHALKSAADEQMLFESFRGKIER